MNGSLLNVPEAAGTFKKALSFSLLVRYILLRINVSAPITSRELHPDPGLANERP